MCGGYFLGTLSTNWASFKHHSLPEYCWWPCPSLYDYSVPIFWCTSSRIIQHVTKIKSSQTGFLNMTMSSLYSNGLHSHQISINRAPLRCDGTRDSHHGCADDKSGATVWCYHDNMDQHLWGMFPKPCWIHATNKQVVPNKVASECIFTLWCVEQGTRRQRWRRRRKVNNL